MSKAITIQALAPFLRNQVLTGLSQMESGTSVYAKVGEHSLRIQLIAARKEFKTLAISCADIPPGATPFVLPEDSAQGREALEIAGMISDGKKLLCRVDGEVTANVHSDAGCILCSAGDSLADGVSAVCKYVKGVGFRVDASMKSSGARMKTVARGADGVSKAMYDAAGAALDIGGEAAKIASDCAGLLVRTVGAVSIGIAQVSGVAVDSVVEAVSRKGEKKAE